MKRTVPDPNCGLYHFTPEHVTLLRQAHALLTSVVALNDRLVDVLLDEFERLDDDVDREVKALYEPVEKLLPKIDKLIVYLKAVGVTDGA